jgi:hypothetical protein
MSKIILYTSDANTATGIREATLDEIMTGARQVLSSHVRKGTVFSSPKITANYLTARLAQHPFEVFTLIYLDNRHRFIAAEDLFRGIFSDAPGHSGIPALARRRRVRRASPTRLPVSRAQALDSVAVSIPQGART